MTTTIPRAPGESTSNSVSDPKDLPTPVQSTSGNVFEGQSAGAAKLKVMNGGGLVQGVTLIGMTLAIMMLA